MLKVFVGHDDRIAIQTNVCMSSIYEHASVPVSITPLCLRTLPIKRRGLTQFSYARFLTPWLCGYEGTALFLDSDVIVRGDVAELFALADPQFAVQVCDIKPDFERAAVMLFNCAHPQNGGLTPEVIETTSAKLHLLDWVYDEHIGYLPANWGHAVGYARQRPVEQLSLIHYTAGVPVWPQTADCEHAEAWHEARRAMCSVRTDWESLMGRSVHSRPGPDGRPLPKWKVPDGVVNESGTPGVDQGLDTPD